MNMNEFRESLQLNDGSEYWRGLERLCRLKEVLNPQAPSDSVSEDGWTEWTTPIKMPPTDGGGSYK